MKALFTMLREPVRLSKEWRKHRNVPAYKRDFRDFLTTHHGLAVVERRSL